MGGRQIALAVALDVMLSVRDNSAERSSGLQDPVALLAETQCRGEIKVLEKVLVEKRVSRCAVERKRMEEVPTEVRPVPDEINVDPARLKTPTASKVKPERCSHPEAPRTPSSDRANEISCPDSRSRSK